MSVQPMIASAFESAAELRTWRKAKRAELLMQRAAMPTGIHQHLSSQVIDRLLANFLSMCTGVIGFYWPFHGEISALPFIERVLAAGGSAALPVVVEKNAPLQFRKWRPGDAMLPGVYGIPYPAEAVIIEPDVLLVPFVGFDAGCYRLGYGGGYYDRTLSTTARKPFTIGLGFSFAKLHTIHPQSYDVPLDVILTEDLKIERCDL